MRKQTCLILAVCTLGSVLFTGCRGPRTFESPARKIGEPTDDERQKQADRKAHQRGEKPVPVNFDRQ